jgi:cytochrome c553
MGWRLSRQVYAVNSRQDDRIPELPALLQSPRLLPDTIMNVVRRTFTPLLAACIMLAAGNAVAADLDRAREIVSGRCFLCHGMAGESSSEVFPRLATQNATYLAKQLRDFQAGRRKATTMNDMVAGLSEAEIVALGTFFQSQTAQPHAPSDAALAEAGRTLYATGKPDAGVASCASCHGKDAHGTESLPRLAGQQALYLESQLRQFDKRERTNDNAVMHAVASRLTEREIRALSVYLASVP